MNKIKFTKMHGAGNDFVLVDDRDGSFPAHDHLRLAALAAPRTGIACEGVILVQSSARADFRMVFFNPDGTEADLCGNGARCVAAFAREIGAARGAAMTFETRAGLVDAEVISECHVKLWMPEPKGRRYDINVDGTAGDFIVAGVPHFIVQCKNVAAVDVSAQGRALRLADAFAPEGANIDFVKYISPNRAVIRTYERGVEAESGACGTGAVAAAVVGVERKGMSLPMRIRTAQGFDLVVDGDWRRSKSTGFTLSGPVKKVFEGEIDLDSLDVSCEME
jgi:diaminopimelate epimerase